MSKSNLPKEKIAILGLGYVGLPLAIAFGKNFETIGFDKNKKRIDHLKKNYDNNNEIKSLNLYNQNI